MKPGFLFLFLAIAFLSCRKTNPLPNPVKAPEMHHIDLKDSVIAWNKAAFFDFDGNGTKDIYFATVIVGDPVYQQDKWQWVITSSFYTNLPVNAEEKIPVLIKSASIPVQNFQGFSWYNASSVILAQKIIGVAGPVYWLGDWKNAVHQFIPFQVIRQEGLFNGWIEVSFETNEEKLVLHKAAISKEANRDTRAGE